MKPKRRKAITCRDCRGSGKKLWSKERCQRCEGSGIEFMPLEKDEKD